MVILFPYHQKLIEPGGESIEDQILEQCLQRGANAAPKLHIICSIQESQIKLSNNKMAHKCSVHYCYIYCTDQKSMGENFSLVKLECFHTKVEHFCSAHTRVVAPFHIFYIRKKLIRMIGFLFLLTKFWQYAFMR